jgi:hypothetical protein
MSGQGRNASVGVSATLGEEQEPGISRRPAAVSSSRTSNSSITTLELSERLRLISDQLLYSCVCGDYCCCKSISHVDAAELEVTETRTSMTWIPRPVCGVNLETLHPPSHTRSFDGVRSGVKTKV